jgi:hypothetical protein
LRTAAAGFWTLKKRRNGRYCPLFLLFLYEIFSERYRVLGGNPGPPAVRRSGKQRDRTLFLRCFNRFVMEIQ